MLKRVLALFTSLVLVLTSVTLVASAEDTVYTVSDTITATLTSDGTLTFSGTGDIPDYGAATSKRPPWNGNLDIKKVIFEDGITSIGNYIIRQCYNVAVIDIAGSVTNISGSAFSSATPACPVEIYYRGENITVSTTSQATFGNQYGTTVYVYNDVAKEIWEEVAAEYANYDFTVVLVSEPTPSIISVYTVSDTITATLTSDGTLTFSGTGDIPDYGAATSKRPPWNGNLDIKKVIFEDGITSIGNYIIRQCYNVAVIDIAGSVTNISGSAFSSATPACPVEIYYRGENITVSTTSQATFGNQYGTTVYVYNDVAKEIWEEVATEYANYDFTVVLVSENPTPSLDYAELNQAIADGEAIDTSKYTDDSVKILTDAIAAGKTVKENTSATQTDVDNAVQAIKDAIDGLKEPLDYTALDQTIYDAETMDTEKYTSATVEILTNAIATGKAVKENASATQEDVNNAVQAIKDAIERLREPVDFTELDKQIARAEEILTHREEYVSVYSVEYALGFAQRVRNDIYAMQSEADTWATNLNNNINNLVKIDVPAMLAELRSVITSAEALDANEYTDDSYQVLADAIEAGKAMNEDSNYQDILDAQSNIEKAVKSLILKPLEEYARVYKNGKVAIIASGKADSAMTGATSVRITFNCASDVSYNNNASIELKAIVAGTESYEKFIGKGDYTTGTNGWTETLALTNPISEGQSYEVSAFTYAWSNASDYVYAVSKVEFLDADGNVLSKVTANTQAFSELQEAIAEAEKIDVSKYTDESVAVLTSALETAKALTDKATIADVTSAKESIEKAVATLELKPIPKGKITGMIIVSDGNFETEMTVVAVSADGTETGVTATSMGSYTIENLEADDYTLTISGGKYAPRSYEITVEEGDNAQDVNLNPYGDINGDGEITTADVGMANSHAKGVTMLIDYEFICANVKLDESITTADVGMINSHAKGVQTLW